VPAEWHCQAETVAPSAVPSAGRGSSPGPSLACPSECCEAAAVSALLLQAPLACWHRSGRPTTIYDTIAKNIMGNILIYDTNTQLNSGGNSDTRPLGVTSGGGFDRGVPESAQN